VGLCSFVSSSVGIEPQAVDSGSNRTGRFAPDDGQKESIVGLSLFMILLIVVLAGWFWLSILKRLDRYRSDKKSYTEIAAFFMFGLLSIIPTIILNEISLFIASFLWGFNETVNEFFYEFLIVGPVEEFSKFIIFVTAARTMRSVREPRDAVLQAAAVALAFASVENVSYGVWYGFGILLERSFLTVLGHMIYSTLWSVPYAIMVYGRRKREPDLRIGPLLRYVVPAAFIHGLYNFLLHLDGLGLALILDGIVLVVAVVMYVTLVKESPYKKYSLEECDQAIARIKPGLRSNPDSYLLNKRMGLYRLYKGNYKAALLYFNRCVRVRLTRNDAWFYRAVTLLLIGREEAGRNSLRRALLRATEKQRLSLYRWAEKLVADETVMIRLREEFDAFEVLRELYGKKEPRFKVRDPWKYRDRKARLWSGYALVRNAE